MSRMLVSWEMRYERKGLARHDMTSHRNIARYVKQYFPKDRCYGSGLNITEIFKNSHPYGLKKGILSDIFQFQSNWQPTSWLV